MCPPHEWQRFKQTIDCERTPEQEKRHHYQTPHEAYFIVRACTKCKAKQIIDIKVTE